MKLVDFNELYDADLQDPEFVARYLRAALADGVESFLVALEDVARVHGNKSPADALRSLGIQLEIKPALQTAAR